MFVFSVHSLPSITAWGGIRKGMAIIIIMKMYIVQKYTEKMKNKNTHEMNELGLISRFGTHELYHKINVFKC